MPNEYAEALHELVQAKVEQRAPEVAIAPESGERPKVINIMDALKKSMQARGQEARSVMPSAAGWAKNPRPRNWGGHQRAPSQPGQGGHCIRRSKESPVAGRGRALVRSVLLSARWGARTRFKRPVRMLVPHSNQRAPITPRSYGGVAEHHLVRINQPGRR